MNNIWQVLLQGISVSITAGIILLIKRILDDKLSPRWQYYVWCVLLLRLIIPARTDYFILHPVPLWLETLKFSVEGMIDSVYTTASESIHISHILPVITGFPGSVTDLIFLVFTSGVAFILIKYLISYCRLRSLLKRGREVSAEMKERIEMVSAKYSLKSCPAVTAETETAFITGVFRPVLVIPDKRETDEKVILHELMHLKYYDGLQNVIWSVFKALNWYNPFMHYIFGEIGSDAESLCDRRVLEVLQGEERRQYGIILLEMVNDKYAGSVGTSNISNGGKNIKRRIAAIVRFRKYPKGMAVASVCMIFVMAFSLLGGYRATYALSDYTSGYGEKAMILSRINRCSTVPGAIDMYAKGILNKNSAMIASVLPVSAHEDFYRECGNNSYGDRYYYDPGRELHFLNPSEGYRIYSLKRNDDDTYEAVLLFHTNGLYKDDSDEMLMTEDGGIYDKCGVAVKIKIYFSDGWCVAETGERTVETSFINLWQPPFDLAQPSLDISASGEYGSVRITTYTEHRILKTASTGNIFYDHASFDMNPVPDAVFSDVHMRTYCEYDSNTRTVSAYPENTYGIQTYPVSSADEEVSWPEDISMNSSVSGTSSSGLDWTVNNVSSYDDDAPEEVRDYYGKVISGSGGNVDFDPDTGDTDICGIYKVRIFWDGVLMDEMTVMEETK